VLVVDSSLGINLLKEREDEIDPHIWLSLRNAAAIVRNICSGLCEADPENRDVYIKNTEAYLEELKALDDHFNQTFAGKDGRIFIVHHPAWTYFAADYNLTQVAIMEEEKEPGPRHLGEIISLARQNNITTIFAEPQLNPRSAEVIASEMNAFVVVLDPLAQDYLQNMRYAGEEIARSLAGQA
jgi:zinc transport system substrate-binding protein